MVIFVDIDGTICRTVDGYENAKPIYENIAKINKLYNEGHTIVYWTARGGNTGIDWSALTRKQLDEWGCLRHDLRLNKPSYDLFVEDKSVRIEEL